MSANGEELAATLSSVVAPGPSAPAGVGALGGARSRHALSRLRALYELGKPNLSALVVITAVLGFYLASPEGHPLQWVRLISLVLGTALTAFGACALNMVLERDLDRQMLRTRGRPIPSGRVTAEQALLYSGASFASGFGILALGAGLIPALLSALTLVVYGLIYTPLKRRGPVAIAVGAIPGAIPPVMGWAAVTGEVGWGGLALFAILFCWQFPHFLALAFMYREDYARAGFRFLAEGDEDGAVTGRQIAIGCAVLLLCSLVPALLGLTGHLYLLGALVAGALFLAAGIGVARRSSLANARRAFFASITYLPALLALLVLDRLLS